MIDPALALGAAVVKTACKIWLKDDAIAADATAGVLDIIQVRVAEKREQRRVRNLFEDLEERVADTVLTGLAVEFGNVPKNDRQAAALAVADTLDKAKLTNRDFFAADLDADRLFRAVKPLGRRYTNTLSQDATELYERILRGCCAYIIEVVNALPGFEVGVFGEVLARQNEILRHVDERFDQLPMQLGGAGAETFEATYLRLVAKQLDKVELFGVTVSDRVGSYPLSVAYVSLSISSSSRLDDSVVPGFHNSMFKPDRRVASIEEALSTTRRAFIRGEAGSGKTTLLQWLAVRCARRDFDGRMRDWNDCVPLFIRLRRYSGTDLPRPEQFLNDVAGSIGHTMPISWLHDLLRSGRAAVLVDGVDELPEQQRRRAREWLRELLIAYPDARWVVTSRPTAAAQSWLDGEAFEALEIQPMTTADIDAFVTHWHAALADGVTSTTEIDRIDASRHELTCKVRTHRHLRMLMVNPLMTALICALHLDRRMQLPHDRTELYSVALEMLLERRDTEREIRSSTVTMTRGEKMLILEDLAYWLVRNGRSNASRERVLGRLENKLTTMHRVTAGAEDVLKHLLDRSGLLRMPVDGQIDFVHKTFQEFLAARAAVAADDIGALARNAHDDQWHEVILMAVAHGSPQQTEELLHEILARSDREYDLRRHVLRALAIGCIQHAPQLPPELYQRLQAVAAELLPPKRMGQASALAGAGELVLELLSDHTDYTVREAVVTIRMAATVGGDHAMSIIANCAAKDASAIRNELMRAWPKFAAGEFARRVLAGSPYEASLFLEDPSALPGLRHLLVTFLTCLFPHGHGLIDYVRDTPELTYFAVRDPKLADLTPLAEHPTLSRLTLWALRGSVDIDPLLHCRQLTDLALPWSSLRNSRPLHELVSLEKFGAFGFAPVGSVLSSLSRELRLRRFELWDATPLDTLSPLVAAPQLPNLDFLLLSEAHSLPSIAGIEAWASTMTGIYLKAPYLTDVERLSALTRLEFANLSGTPTQSLEFLQGCDRLNRLHIGADGELCPDLTPLRDLSALRYLHIWGDQAVDVSGLARADNLTIEIYGSRRRPVHGKEKLPSSVKIVRR